MGSLGALLLPGLGVVGGGALDVVGETVADAAGGGGRKVLVTGGGGAESLCETSALGAGVIPCGCKADGGPEGTSGVRGAAVRLGGAGRRTGGGAVASGIVVGTSRARGIWYAGAGLIVGTSVAANGTRSESFMTAEKIMPDATSVMPPARYKPRFSFVLNMLPRQDSNLDRLIQNQQCFHYTTGDSL